MFPALHGSDCGANVAGLIGGDFHSRTDGSDDVLSGN